MTKRFTTYVRSVEAKRVFAGLLVAICIISSGTFALPKKAEAIPVVEVGFGVHHWQTVALVILLCDGAVAQHLTGGTAVSIHHDAVLVRPVIVVAEDAMLH